MTTPLEGKELPLEYLREYDGAAEQMARTGKMPLNMGSPGAIDYIEADPESFERRVNDFSYAQAMERRVTPRQLRSGQMLAILAASLIALQAQAVSPPPDGGYPGANTAEGQDALFRLATGRYNTAIGYRALFHLTRGYYNTAIGYRALVSNTTGGDNSAIGAYTLFSNTNGYNNTASGSLALIFNTTGNNNTANGAYALSNNTTGGNNIALGVSAGANLTIGNDNIDIGNDGVIGESGTIRIGDTQTATYIAGITGKTIEGATVVIDANGQLGVTNGATVAQLQKQIDALSAQVQTLTDRLANLEANR